MAKTQQVTFTATVETIEKVDKLAAKKDRSRSWMINAIVEERFAKTKAAKS